jgi:hypothetical protein
MELDAARTIIDTLAQGIHPVSGQPMPDDSPYNAPPVIRALFAVSQALKDSPRRRNLPPNTGKAWAQEDDAQLLAGFDAGGEPKDLARMLGRTRYAVEARLVKLGKLPAGLHGVPFLRT